jgi:hypothetical protein
MSAYADSEGPNSIYVVASVTDGTAYRGDRYAKSVPAQSRGTDGRTHIYIAREGADQLEHTYDWYSPTVFLAGTSKGTSVVRFGPWNKGHEANASDLAVAFYFDGKPLREYSTLDVAGKPGNVEASVSHYQWAKKIHGYCWLKSKQARTLRFGFAIVTTDDRVLAFDITTGNVLKDWYPE